MEIDVSVLLDFRDVYVDIFAFFYIKCFGFSVIPPVHDLPISICYRCNLKPGIQGILHTILTFAQKYTICRPYFEIQP